MPMSLPLTPSGKRAVVANEIDSSIGVDIGPALLIADTLDAVSAAVCRAAGMTDNEARVVLRLLWCDK